MSGGVEEGRVLIVALWGSPYSAHLATLGSLEGGGEPYFA